jgi:hypothetical protein
VCLAALEKILTMDNLWTQRVIVADRCCMCKRFVDHLFRHCEVAYAIWNILFNQFGFSWVMLRRVIDLYAC